MITLVSLGAAALWSCIATIEAVRKDGYGRVPDTTPYFYPLP